MQGSSDFKITLLAIGKIENHYGIECALRRVYFYIT